MRAGGIAAHGGIAILGRPVAGTIAVLARDSAVLLVQRRNPPDAGLWGYPGGKIESGETITKAALRELHEETSIVGVARGLLPPFDVIRHDADGRLTAHFVLLPVLCTWVSGDAAASSDALAVGWFTFADLVSRSSMLCERVIALARDAMPQEWGAAPHPAKGFAFENPFK